MSSHASVSSLESVSRPLELIEREITRLAAVIAADCCRWLGLIAEFDRRRGWAQWGCHSCAVWVSWQCAVAPPAAREYVRVARRLDELPRIRAAFAAGELSYSKVRALTRVGTIERERELLELARDATAAQLERLVRAYRGVEAVERAAAGEAPERYLRLDAADDGGVLIRGRLGAEEAALLARALDVARGDLERRHAVPVGAQTRTHEDPAGPGVSAETSPPADRAATRGERDADALVLLADTLLAHGAAERSGADRYQVVVHVDADTLTGHDAGGRCDSDNGQPLAAETGRRLACDASLVALLHRRGSPLAVGRRTRTIGPALRRALAARDRGCRFPARPPQPPARPPHPALGARGPDRAWPTSSRSATATTGSCTKAATRSPTAQTGSSSGGPTPGHPRPAHNPLRRAATQATPHQPFGPARPRHRRAARPRARRRRPPHPRPTAEPARTLRRRVTTNARPPAT